MPYRKAGTKNWYITWSENGVPRTRSSRTTDYAEARRIEQQHRGQARTTLVSSLESTPTIGEVLAEYLSDKPSTRAAYATIKLVEGFGEQTEIAALSPAVITAYSRSRDVKPSTLARELGVLRAAIRHCRQRLGWDIPVVTDGQMPREPRGRIRWITYEESDRLINAVSNRAAHYLRDYIILSLHTGLRKGELLSLTWGRIDEVNRVIHFEPHHHKSDTYAAVPLNQTAWDVLEKRRTLKQGPYVLMRKSGKAIGDIKKGFRAACEAAGIENFTPHDLRHTCASWLVQSGVPLEIAKEILRHADIATTMRYAHFAPKNLADSVGVLDCRKTAGVQCTIRANSGQF